MYMYTSLYSHYFKYINVFVPCAMYDIIMHLYTFYSASNQMPSLSWSDAGHPRQAYCPGSHITNPGADTNQRAWCTHGCAG